MRGDLSETSLAAVWRSLGVERASGTLVIDGADGPGTVELHQGAIVAAAAPVPAVQLAERLTAAGHLTSATLAEVLAELDPPVQVGSDTPAHAIDTEQLARALLERQLAPPDLVTAILRHQVLDALLALSRWRFGTFVLHPATADAPARLVELQVEDALEEVQRRQADLDRLPAAARVLESVPTIRTDTDADAGVFGADELLLLSAVDERRDLRGLAQRLGYGGYDVVRLVGALAARGVVDLRLPEDGVGAALDAALHTVPAPPPEPAHAATPEPEPAATPEPEPEPEPEAEPEPVAAPLVAFDLSELEPQPADDQPPPAADPDPAPPAEAEPTAGIAPEPEPAPEPAPEPGTAPAPAPAIDDGFFAGPAPAATAAQPPAPAPQPPVTTDTSDDTDVSEFLRELSSLALGDSGPRPRGPAPRPRGDEPPGGSTGRSPGAPSDSSDASSGTAGSEGGTGTAGRTSDRRDDSRRRKRGFFSRG